MNWLEERRKGLGGSDMPVVLGLSPWKTPYELWLEKTGRTPIVDDPTPVMQRGTALEPIVADIYRQKTGRKLRRSRLILEHPEHEWMIANIDRHIVAQDDGRGPGVLEIKVPGIHVYGKIKREGLLDYYIVQLQHYMGVTQWQWGAFGVFNAEAWDMIHFDMPRDDRLIDMIVEKGNQFWRLVQSDTPPPETRPDDIEMPHVGGTLVRIETQEWAQSIADLREATLLQKEAQEMADAVKCKLRDIMSDMGADVAEGAGARIYNREQSGRVTFDKRALAKEHPEIDIARYEKTGKPFKTFKVYFLKGEA